jgi:oxygen-independent coproporphyrinogen-3 oxidase
MEKEMALRRNFLSSPLDTIYFGGGTPSLLDGDQLSSFLAHAERIFGISPQAEITLEANPDDLTGAKLRAIRAAGINRLSIGIQSFQDDILRYLHRAHDAKAARQSLEASREAGFANISIDLIYAIPGLDLPRWEATLHEAGAFRPEHLSAYSLTIEDRTVFGNYLRKGKIRRVDDEPAARQFERMQDVLEEYGYEHYEISNFSLPGLHSRHNSSYWLQEPYLGIGPSAHSYDGIRRSVNLPNNAKYVQALRNDQIPATVEELTSTNRINEYILTRLRTRWGLDLHVLHDQLGDDLPGRTETILRRYADQGLLKVTGAEVKLTRKGMLLADQITEDLMVE